MTTGGALRGPATPTGEMNMKVELLVPRATATGSENRGDVVEVSADEAKRMIEAGQAMPVRAAAAAEKTVARTAKAEKTAK